MIVVTDQPGQLGNQLWAFTNIIALGKECKSRVIIIISKEYFNFLNIEQLRKNSNGKLILFKEGSIGARIIKRAIEYLNSGNEKSFFFKHLINLLPKEVINNYINEEQFKKQYKKKKLYFINSWQHGYNKQFFINHNSYIRSLIIPNKILKEVAEKKISALRRSENLIVGVHIRRGDYKIFANGKFYYEDEIYLSYMKQIDTLFSEKKVVFCIFSDEQINLENFKELNVVHSSDQTAISDMWSMSRCDYIIGPMSTFSMWASFWNKVPLFFMTVPIKTLYPGSFKPIKAQDLFDDDVCLEHDLNIEKKETSIL